MATRTLTSNEIDCLLDIRWMLTGFRAAERYDITTQHIGIIDDIIRKGQITENGVIETLETLEKR
jgi:hypothetical protein